ncbi:hypothetical protein BGX27_005314, partial [Mortierella sp. AM989]
PCDSIEAAQKVFAKPSKKSSGHLRVFVVYMMQEVKWQMLIGQLKTAKEAFKYLH